MRRQWRGECVRPRNDAKKTINQPKRRSLSVPKPTVMKVTTTVIKVIMIVVKVIASPILVITMTVKIIIVTTMEAASYVVASHSGIGVALTVTDILIYITVTITIIYTTSTITMTYTIVPTAVVDASGVSTTTTFIAATEYETRQSHHKILRWQRNGRRKKRFAF